VGTVSPLPNVQALRKPLNADVGKQPHAIRVETITPTLAFFVEGSQASYVQEDGHNASCLVCIGWTYVHSTANLNIFGDIYIRMGENLYVYFGFPTKICNFTAV